MNHQAQRCFPPPPPPPPLPRKHPPPPAPKPRPPPSPAIVFFWRGAPNNTNNTAASCRRFKQSRKKGVATRPLTARKTKDGCETQIPYGDDPFKRRLAHHHPPLCKPPARLSSVKYRPPRRPTPRRGRPCCFGAQRRWRRRRAVGGPQPGRSCPRRPRPECVGSERTRTRKYHAKLLPLNKSKHH